MRNWSSRRTQPSHSATVPSVFSSFCILTLLPFVHPGKQGPQLVVRGLPLELELTPGMPELAPHLPEFVAQLVAAAIARSRPEEVSEE